MSPGLVLFVVFALTTIVVIYAAAGSGKKTRGFYTTHHRVGGVQNGWALAGDYLSAASFLGVTGLVSFYGFDGFMYAVGWLVAYLTLLLLVAEPLRNTGRYTLADILAFRNHGASVRATAAISTIVITLFYMIAQVVGAGSLAVALLPQLSLNTAIVLAGLLMIVYVTLGGILSTTWVQIIKAAVLLAAAAVLSLLVLAHYHFSFGAFAADVGNAHVAGTSLFDPGLRFRGPFGPLDVISLGLALVLGTAGLPHILVRFYTVPSAKAARTSVAWAAGLISVFYLLTMLVGFGATAIVGVNHIGPHMSAGQAIAYIAHHTQETPQLNAELQRHGFIVPVKNSNLAAVYLAQQLGGDVLFAVVTAIAFATILAVVAGLTISAASTFARDIWANVVPGRDGDERSHLNVARFTAVSVTLVSTALALCLKNLNVAVIIGLAFAVAASANVPAIVLTLVWKRFNSAGAVAGMIAGLVSSIALIVIGPDVMGLDPLTAPIKHVIQMAPLFPLANPGLVSIPLGFLGAIAGSLLTRDTVAEELFEELEVRANTGLGVEV